MSDFAQLQQQFMQHIRATEAGTPPAGVEARRMNVYRELMFNNVAGFVDSGFPVLKSLTEPALWQQRLRRFFAEHDCHSPLFVDISAEFVQFLAAQTELQPWEAALAHYEQLELRIDILPEVTDQRLLTEAEQLLTSPLCLYRAAEIGQYGYPVHQIGEHNRQPEPNPTYLLVYRDLDDDVAFMELNPLSARLLQQLQQQPGSNAEQIAQAMVAALPQMDAAVVAQGAGQLLLQLASKGIVRVQQ
ncbi:putative DNA-binding domain-containing protein [uncultured Ferrimonas sp.]|uniref:HvfC family RiPP maturation protein n=1 Tax=uncultured Ferrimonas sp. TaxID=432640 RepID=UPI0026290BC7|nr:putative DNA-binding domain-containing protein [uncultured Ferrimonas sp.]